ncbi:2-dehydropantoate 2-reductase [Microdochium bolleyi]|uniref:2-dehydropantoate 2-reductase n=1 Tax=Microdochium bolleyi TaxID=196109 RepID=A0A136IL47_9PEZI|nr:2-dehydropantoate 2-reductase [Microdochium bolleyi]
MAHSTDPKARIAIVGGGGVGTLAAYNLEAGGRAETAMVLRSNYTAVNEHGFAIDSCQHGTVQGWRPRGGLIASSAAAATVTTRFDYAVCCTKNIPDVGPSVADLLTPYVTPGHTVIVLIQNGINIETPLLAAFPRNVVLSGISLIGVIEEPHGHILHNDPDILKVGYFPNDSLSSESQERAARDFVELYAASGKVTATYDADVRWTRWRKLLYNAVYNPIAALTDIDSARLRLCAREDKTAPPRSHNALDHLILPAMREVQAAALAAHGVVLPDELLGQIVETEPITEHILPSMQQDVRKGRAIECEVILGETLRLGEAAGVAMPVLTTLYCLCRALQFRAREKAGLVDVDEMASRY